MLTLEPILEFDMDIMIKRIEDIDPHFIWLGTVETKSVIYKKKLEPSLDKILQLYTELGKLGYVVMLKKKLIDRLAE